MGSVSFSIDPLTAAITAGMASALFLVARGQLGTMARTSRASVLEQLNTRWTAPTMKEAREEGYRLLRNAAAKCQGLPQAECEVRFRAECSESLRKKKEEEPIGYLKLMDVCNFFETVGYSARQDYVSINGILELYAGAIVTAGRIFEAHIIDGRTAEGAPKLFEHFSWLVLRAQEWLRRMEHTS